MFTIWYHGLICIFLLWIRRKVAADGEDFERNVTLTWDEARKYCKDIGTVLLDVTENGSDMFLNKTLKDTNQTWVSARIDFSRFYKVPVCMKTPKRSIERTILDTDIVGNCFKFCNEYLYAGLMDRKCFCFEAANTLERSYGCNKTCIYNPIFQCGGNELISLYEKADKTITKHIKSGSKECVYATGGSGALILHTESCVGYLANGAMCEKANATACREHNWTVINITICRMDLKFPLTWNQAKELCGGIGGHLMSSALSSRNIKSNSTYWHGLFRYPILRKVNESQGITSDSDCAIVRKIGDFVIVEGDNCLEKGTFICQDDTLMRSSSSPRSTTSPEIGSNFEPNDAKFIIGMIAAAFAMLLVVSVITALVCLHRRRQVSQLAREKTINSSSVQLKLLKRQITNSPAKPLRTGLAKGNRLQSSYENIKLSSRTSEETVKQPGNKTMFGENINIDKEHIQENISKEETAGLYQHVSPRLNEDEYDLTVLPGVKNLHLDETYDRTTFGQCLDNAYSLLSDERSEEVKNHANSDYDL